MKKRMESEHSQEEQDIVRDPNLRDLPFTIGNLPRLPLLAIIRAYQLTLSKAMPAGTCRFYPTCSHYGYQAIYRYGVVKGSLMAGWRVLRCNPFNPGGFDPVP
jgi:uncharacterized protein